MRLIANLSFIQMEVNGHPLRLDCCALLLEERESLFISGQPRHCVRGFGTDGAWQVFTFWLNCGHLEYELMDAASNNVIVMSDAHPEGLPLFSGVVIKFKDGTELFLQAEDQEQPLDVSDHEEYESLWAELGQRVRRYYRAPYFPVLNHVPKAFA